MANSKEFDPAWNSIYHKGEQLNLYPYDSVVSFLMNNYAKQNRIKPIKVLEIGCGAGNNLWFAAREGFSVTGLDASEDAIAFAKQRFKKDSLEGSFNVGSFTNLPYDDSQFDVVIDRAATTHVDLKTAKIVISQVHRVLKQDGVFYSEVFSDQASSKGVLDNNDMLCDVEGPYSGVGNVYLYSKNKLLKLYQEQWELLELAHTERKQYMQKNGIKIYASWSLAAKKQS